MPRQAREKGEFSTYHIIQRGNERKNLFLSDEDKSRFLETLKRMKEKYNFLVYVYCLMDNHIHLVINDNGHDISKIMKSINVSYAIYFNRKNKRCGHLFQDRFKSELIIDDIYLLQVSKYIHNNPVKAGMVKEPEEYKWSSYNIYLGKIKNDLIDTNKVLENINDRKNDGILQYKEYINQEDTCKVTIMDVDENEKLNSNDNNEVITTIEEARIKINQIAKEKNISMTEALSNKMIRNEIMKKIRKNSTLTLKEIGNLFGGISESRVSRILRSHESKSRTVPVCHEEPSQFAMPYNSEVACRTRK